MFKIMEVAYVPFPCHCTMKSEDLASFRSLPKAEKEGVDAIGIGQWAAWEEKRCV